ncbi:MAG TPA: hypothetical protein VKB80_10245, partial [Kofleriaceae bacterium]|nr:hypothetical protein [Kofleriaceae bacterium]
DGAGRLDLAFERVPGGEPGAILVVHTEPVTEPAVIPAFEGPCRLATDPGDEALAPTTAIDPASDDLHVLFQIDGADGGSRLAHARVPSWP